MDFPYPKTNIFTREEDALTLIKNCTYPIVLKSIIGSASSVVEIVRVISHAVTKKKENISELNR